MKSFYDSLKQDADGSFPVKQFDKLPDFCRPIPKDGNPHALSYFDAWDVHPSGDGSEDHETGRRNAEQAVSYARTMKSPDFIAVVLMAIEVRSSLGDLSAFSVAYGFYSRLAELACAGSLN